MHKFRICLDIHKKGGRERNRGWRFLARDNEEEREKYSGEAVMELQILEPHRKKENDE